MQFQEKRSKSPNDPKLSDAPERRSACWGEGGLKQAL
jgi:hypothetical protein